jgi:hypothetical protein
MFALISELVLWESTTNEEELNRDREEIRRSWRRCCARRRWALAALRQEDRAEAVKRLLWSSGDTKTGPPDDLLMGA